MRNSRSSRDAIANGFRARIMRRKRIAGKFPSRVAALRKKYNLGSRPTEAARPRECVPQMTLGFELIPSRRIYRDWQLSAWHNLGVLANEDCGPDLQDPGIFARLPQNPASQQAGYSEFVANRRTGGRKALTSRRGKDILLRGGFFPLRENLRQDDARLLLRETHFRGELGAQEINKHAGSRSSVGPQPPKSRKKHQQLENFGIF